MNKMLLTLLVLVVAAPALAREWFKGPFNEALATARSQKKAVLIDFFGIG